jgi:hypothetical protein
MTFPSNIVGCDELGGLCDQTWKFSFSFDRGTVESRNSLFLEPHNAKFQLGLYKTEISLKFQVLMRLIASQINRLTKSAPVPSPYSSEGIRTMPGNWIFIKITSPDKGPPDQVKGKLINQIVRITSLGKTMNFHPTPVSEILT